MTTQAFVLPILMWKHSQDEKPRPIAIVSRGTLSKSTDVPAFEGKLKLFGGPVVNKEDIQHTINRELSISLPNLMSYIKLFRGELCVEDFSITISVKTLVRCWSPINRVFTTQQMRLLVDDCDMVDAEFYDINNRPFTLSEWSPSLSGLAPLFASYQTALSLQENS